ncbi:MAG: succinate dehydrogenase, cytochrome b556 subunit [Proteobacteria bacterium]|nr:succinate dehydrogenase, cytochrome b556 subunit [Pseudomonadota bacterium]
MATPQRPLSPHWQVYKPQITTVLSILHRATGIVLAVGAFALAAWLLAIGASEETYAQVSGYVASWPGKLLLAACSWCLFYHLCNGIRHLFWDAGKGFEIKQFYASGWVVVVVSFVLTGGLWAGILTRTGGL